MEASAQFEVLEDGETFFIAPHGRFFAVYQKFTRLIEEEDDQPPKLVCIAVYKVGAEEVKRRLEGKVQVKRHSVVCRSCRANTFGEIAAEP